MAAGAADAETFTVRIGPADGRTVDFELRVADILRHPAALLCSFFQNRQRFKQGESFDRDPELFGTSVKPFYERGTIPVSHAGLVEAVEQEFVFFGLPFDVDNVVLPTVGETVRFRFNSFVGRLYRSFMQHRLLESVHSLQSSHEFTVQDLGMEAIETDFFQRAFTSPPYNFEVRCKFERRGAGFEHVLEVCIPADAPEGSEAHLLAIELNTAIRKCIETIVTSLLTRTGKDWLGSPYELELPADKLCKERIRAILETEFALHVEDWGVTPFLCSCPKTCAGLPAAAADSTQSTLSRYHCSPARQPPQ